MRTKAFLIQPLGFDAAVAHAARELESYLPRLAPVNAVALSPRGGLAADHPAALVLGTSDHLRGLGLGPLPKLHELDDALAIIPKGKRLYLVGANPRSVLFAAYRLLEELGAVFLRPGVGGEAIPRAKALRLPKKPIREKASYRHRGICIEGAPRIEHVLGVLDWMAKKKMNTFQLQFRHAGVFWRKGYASPEMDDATRGHVLSDADCEALDERVIARLRELGMILHRVGHGWTAFALGLPGNDWRALADQPGADRRGWLAEINGRRATWKDTPINTELCYSQPDARAALVGEVVVYARRHSEVDVLHVWASDAFNNKCECADCRRMTPSDWYSLVVEEIGQRLKAEGLKTRVVFLAYVDMLWPPKKVKAKADNVVLMFAPITRCYRHALDDRECDDPKEHRRPRLNRAVMPRTNRPFAELARMWKERRLPDSFVFDYHMMWAVWRDGMGQDVGDVMAQDMQDLAKLGIDGLVSCQCTRAFYPLPWLPNAMCDLLWNRRLPIAEHRRRVMRAAFGPNARAVESYFARTVKACRVGDGYEHGSLLRDVTPERRRALAALADHTEKAWLRFAELTHAEKNPVIQASLALVAIHAEHLDRIARALLAGIDGNRRLLDAMKSDYGKRLPEILASFHTWIDPLIRQPVEQAFREAERLLET